jgi:hypothetical protein
LAVVTEASRLWLVIGIHGLSRDRGRLLLAEGRFLDAKSARNYFRMRLLAHVKLSIGSCVTSTVIMLLELAQMCCSLSIKVLKIIIWQVSIETDGTTSIVHGFKHLLLTL